jgi:hypothetical protein
MDMILLDWTRMGKTYCLAGVVCQNGEFRIVRPMPKSNLALPVRNIGWSHYQMDGRQRWQVFELVRPEAAPPLAPHLEDVWVRELRTQGRFADLETRRAILQQTTVEPGEPLFGAPFVLPEGKAFVPPGHGARSLVTVVVPRDCIAFSVYMRPDKSEPLYRVRLDVDGLREYVLPLKDHCLLGRVQQMAVKLDVQRDVLAHLVGEMGQQVAVRVGLSRAYSAIGKEEDAVCWLMADGFFSLANPQP